MAEKKITPDLQEKENKRLAVDALPSEHRGINGAFETLLRRFKNFFHALYVLPLYVVGSAIIGCALFPAIMLFNAISDATSTAHPLLHIFAQGCGFGLGFFAYGFTLITILPIFNWILRARLRPWRGAYYSIGSVRWYIHNSITYLARYTFLEFITPTPFNIQFYRAMGMKIGKDTQINTTNISDPSLIEIGDRATIAGSATLIAHYASNGFLVIAPLKIGKGATIGLKATLMGGVEVGDYALVLPNSVVLAKTIIPAGEVWGGVPAARIESMERARKAA